jgi:phosphatidylinositol alpha-1,6-mannosyltransferase
LGSWERYKGHDVILRALPSVVVKVPKLTYAVVGDGDDRPRLQELAQELGVEEHVAFRGEISDSELVALYRRSELFAMPARTVIDDHDPKGEGFGIVYLEAMAFGKPVIGPSYGAPAEIIQHGKTGLLVDPEDPAQVAEAILELLENPGMAREMGKAGSNCVRADYSYEKFRERLQELIDHRDTRAPRKGVRSQKLGVGSPEPEDNSPSDS